MKTKNRLVILLACLSLTTVGGCAVVGMGAGGLAGHALAGGAGHGARIAATLVGGGVGYVVGDKLGDKKK